MLFKSSTPSSSIECARAYLEKQENTVVGMKPHETRPIVGKAFGGKTIDKCEPMTAYVLQSLGEIDDKDRQELAGFFFGFFVHETLQKGGLAFGIREDNSEDGPVNAVVIFREYDPHKENHNKPPSWLDKIRKTVAEIRAYMAMKNDPVGLPAILNNDPAQKKKFEKACEAVASVQDLMRGWHTKHGPPEKHWYVCIVATDPYCPSKGHGKKIMSLMGQMADQTRMACYLECPDYNRGFYEKCGYKMTSPMIVSLSSEMCGDYDGQGYLMTREPQIPTSQ